MSLVDSAASASGSTLYKIASTGKILAAAAVLRLVDSGRLSLDDPAASVLPSGLVPGRLGDVLVNTRHASLGALEIEGDVAKAVLGLEPDLVDLPVDAALGAVFEGTYSGDREGTRYVVSHRDSSPWREGAAGDAPLKLLRQDSVTFGRDDWPFDRLVFEVHGGQASSFSVYYNGFFDGRYQRVAAEGAFR